MKHVHVVFEVFSEVSVECLKPCLVIVIIALTSEGVNDSRRSRYRRRIKGDNHEHLVKLWCCRFVVAVLMTSERLYSRWTDHVICSRRLCHKGCEQLCESVRAPHCVWSVEYRINYLRLIVNLRCSLVTEIPVFLWAYLYIRILLFYLLLYRIPDNRPSHIISPSVCAHCYGIEFRPVFIQHYILEILSVIVLIITPSLPSRNWAMLMHLFPCLFKSYEAVWSEILRINHVERSHDSCRLLNEHSWIQTDCRLLVVCKRSINHCRKTVCSRLSLSVDIVKDVIDEFQSLVAVCVLKDSLYCISCCAILVSLLIVVDSVEVYKRWSICRV